MATSDLICPDLTGRLSSRESGLRKKGLKKHEKNLEALVWLCFARFTCCSHHCAGWCSCCLPDWRPSRHPRIRRTDRSTVVCAELRKQGISVSDPVYEASASTSAYRVVLRRLGEKILVHLSQETPIGTIFIERQLWIANIKEMSTAAPKLVNALLHEKPIASNVAEHEARELQKIKGGPLWHIGFLGVISAPSRDLVGGPGLNLGWSNETPSFAVGGEFQISGRAEYVPGQDSFLFYSGSIGGRYFFNKQNISPI